MKEIIVGTKYESNIEVTENLLALNVGSGDVNVYATPMMIALMENAAANCLKSFLDEAETSVGGYIATSHVAATPCKMNVKAIAEITAVEGKKVEFKVSAFDDSGLIGEGTHTRFIVLKERFEQKAQAKINA